MNTIKQEVIKLDTPRRVLRFMLFATDPTKDNGEGLGGFLFDHDDFDYITTFVNNEAPHTRFSAFEILDTETFDVHRMTITHEKERTYRVVLMAVPEDKREAVLAYLAGVLTVSARDIPLYVQTMPSFVGTNLGPATAQAMEFALTQLGATVRVEPE